MSAAANDDAAILAAWEQHKAARATYDALPHSELPMQEYTPEELEQWAIMDATEEVIRSTKATTLTGVEIQLWTALGHSLNDNDECVAALRGDLAWFDAREADFDWIDRLTLSAIRSLRTIASAA